MKVSVMMAPKTSKSQVGAHFCCGWGNCHIWINRDFDNQIINEVDEEFKEQLSTFHIHAYV
jgi:hypothetical protein